MQRRLPKSLSSSQQTPWATGHGSVFVSGRVDGSITVNVVSGKFEQLATAIQRPERLRAQHELDRFAGRAWLIQSIERAIAEQPSGYVIVRADAGVGKTTVAAHLIGQRRCPFHITKLSGTGRNPERARKNLAAQLIRMWELYDMAPDDSFPPEANEPDWLERVIESAARARDEKYPDEPPPIVLVVDGLDEAEPSTDGRDTGVPLGLPRPSDLPRGVHIVATSRYGLTTAWVRSRRDYYADIRVSSEDNISDMRLYLEQLFTGEKPDHVLVQRLQDAHIQEAHFIDTLLSRSRGVWIYLRYILDEMRATMTPRSVSDLHSLPHDLHDYYIQQIERWMQDADRWDTLCLPTLATLVALREPFERKDIARFAAVPNNERLRRWLDGELRPFLDVIENTEQRIYGVLHQSLRDVFGPRTAPALGNNGDAGLTAALREALAHAHARITSALAPTSDDTVVDWTKISDYARQTMPEHAALGGHLPQLVQDAGFVLMCDPVQILRRRGYCQENQEAVLAIGALEGALAQWSSLNRADRSWWLHVWACRMGSHALARSAWAYAGRPERVQYGTWAGTTHRTLQAHIGPVNFVRAVRADDRPLLVSGGDDGSVQLWDSATGVPLQSLGGNEIQVYAGCSFHFAGRTFLVTVGEGGEVSICDLTNGITRTYPLRELGCARATCSIQIGGRSVLVIAGDSGVIHLWDISTDPTCAVKVRYPGQVKAICAVQNGSTTFVAAGTDDGIIRLVDPVTSRVPREIQAHAGPVLALSPIRLREWTALASAGFDGNVCVWDPASGTLKHILKGHSGAVGALCPIRIRDKTILVSGGDDQTVRLWDPEANSESAVQMLYGHDGPITSVCPVPIEGRQTLLASTGRDGTVRLWAPIADASQRTLSGHVGGAWRIDTIYSASGTRLVSIGDDETLWIWNLITGKAERRLKLTLSETASMCSVQWRDETRIALGGNDGAIRIFNPFSEEIDSELIGGHFGRVSALCTVHVDGTPYVCSAGDDGRVILWDLMKGAVARSMRHEAVVDAYLSYGQDNDADKDKTGEDKAEEGRILLSQGASALATIGDAGEGRAAVAVAFPNILRIWDPITGSVRDIDVPATVTEMCSIRAHRGYLLACIGRDGSIFLLDPNSEKHHRLDNEGVHARSLCLAFQGGQTLLAIGGRDGAIRLLNPSSMTWRYTMVGHTGSVRCLHSSHFNNRSVLISASDDQSILWWQLPEWRR